MTSQPDTPVRRIFKYGGQTFPDPGAAYSTDQVLQHLRAYFPELGHAKVSEKQLPDGTLEITFSKQISRKGADSSAAAALVTALAGVPVYDNPLTPVYTVLGLGQRDGQRPLTLATLRQHRSLFRTHANQLQAQTTALHKVIDACQQLAPIPTVRLPLGF